MIATEGRTQSSPKFRKQYYRKTFEHRNAETVSKPEIHDLILKRRNVVGDSKREIPSQILLLCLNKRNPNSHQLFIDQIPVPREAWNYDPHDKILHWKGLHGGGYLHIYHDSKGATGVIGGPLDGVNVIAGAKAQFLCSIAEDCGVEYITQGSAVTGLDWDPDSAKWKNADWQKDRLLMTYTVTQGSPIEPPTFTFEFEDKLTDSVPWQPGEGSFEAGISLGHKGNEMVWELVFKSSIDPPSDSDQEDSETANTVFPFWLRAIEDSAAITINGGLEIDKSAPNGTLIGMQGQKLVPELSGYFQVSSKSVPFAIFNGQMLVNGKAVANCKTTGTNLKWSELAEEHQKRLGLGEAGNIKFNKNGSHGWCKQQGIMVKRLSPNNSIALIAQHKEHHPQIHAAIEQQNEMLASTDLQIQGLLAMSSYSQNSKGEWCDVVQTAVRKDLTEIMNSFVPSDIWNLLFKGIQQPTLTGYLATVANSPVKGVDDPIEWYKNLGTAVMTQGMANGSDENCKYMNGPRAANWLKEEVTNSKVYHAHGQLLFQYHWKAQNPETTEYLNDQISNAAKWEPLIDQKTQESIDDINKNVIESEGSPDDLKKKLISKVTDAGQYAKTNNLFWAFAFFNYNVAPSILANIALQMGTSTGSGDGSTLSRLFQQNVTVLTAIDPSGYFAQQYNQTINLFLGSNVLPSMYGFKDDGNSFDLIKEYLEQFVKQNINNEDQQIAEAAQQIAGILAQEDADELLKNSIDALRAFSETIQDALALPYIANKWLKWFSGEYPKLSKVGSVFGSVLITGLTTMAMFNLILGFKNWSSLNKGQKAELITESIQIGLQILAAVVKRGVRLYAIFNVDGMSIGQRAAAMFRIAFEGEADQLNNGLTEISNGFASWIGDTEGSLMLKDMENDPAGMRFLFDDPEELSLTAKIFGRNLDEFIATRVGPLFILAGMGLSIYFMASGETGIALASDIINLIGGSLTLFSMVGGWLVEGGIIAAEGVLATIISVAGPLAIIAALVGIALMLYQMFKKQPDPVEEFVNKFVKAAGFYVASKCGSIDYAIPYALKSKNNLMMLGLTLTDMSSTNALTCNSDGSISLDVDSSLPKNVWKSVTNGLGLSQFATLVEDSNGNARGLVLSLLSDNTISFQPRMVPSKKTNPATNGEPTVVTQMWLTTPQSEATTTNDDTDLEFILIDIQPVLPDENGEYYPKQAKGYLIAGSSGVQYSQTSPGTFKLTMSGIAPNLMKMKDLSFILNTEPSKLQSFGPSFGIPPSTPLSFSLEGGLPEFLDFDPKLGVFTPNGKGANEAYTSSNTISASNNDLGGDSAKFTIKVAASSDLN